MLTVILFLLSSIGVSIINGSTCACCFPWLGNQCQTPAIVLSCADCTTVFCAMHVKGCQGPHGCQAVCQDPSSTTTSLTSSSSTTTSITSSSSTTTAINGGSIIRIEFFIISFSLTLLTFFQLNN